MLLEIEVTAHAYGDDLPLIVEIDWYGEEKMTRDYPGYPESVEVIRIRQPKWAKDEWLSYDNMTPAEQEHVDGLVVDYIEERKRKAGEI